MNKILFGLVMLFALSGCDLIDIPITESCEDGYILVDGECEEVGTPLDCEQGYIEENGVCVIDLESCIEGYELIDDKCVLIEDNSIDPTIKQEFLDYLDEYEDYLMFSYNLIIAEETNTIVRNESGKRLLETNSNLTLKFDLFNQIIDIYSNAEGSNEFNMQMFAHNNDLVTVLKTMETFDTSIVLNQSFEEKIDEMDSSRSLSEKVMSDIEKLGDFRYRVTYDKLEFFTPEELNIILGNDPDMSTESMESIVVEFDFEHLTEKKIKLEVTLSDVSYLEEYIVEVVIKQNIELPDELTIEVLRPGGITIEPAKSMDQVFLVFDVNEIVYFNQTDGDNILAYRLPPGDYGVFTDYSTNQTSSPYLRVYDEFGNEILRDNYIHVDEETTMYFNFTASNGWSQEDRPMVIREVTPVHIGETDPENIHGEITLEFTEENLQHAIVFPDSFITGFILFETDDIDADNHLLLQGSTRCEGFTGEVGCAVKTYESTHLSIHFTSLKPDTVTLQYQLLEYDSISNDQYAPTPISSIENGVQFERDVNYYFSFESTGDTYIFDLLVLHPGYYVSHTANLYNDQGTLIQEDWNNNLYLEPGIYVIEVSAWGLHSAIIPQVLVVESD